MQTSQLELSSSLHFWSEWSDDEMVSICRFVNGPEYQNLLQTSKRVYRLLLPFPPLPHLFRAMVTNQINEERAVLLNRHIQQQELIRSFTYSVFFPRSYRSIKPLRDIPEIIRGKSLKLTGEISAKKQIGIACNIHSLVTEKCMELEQSVCQEHVMHFSELTHLFIKKYVEKEASICIEVPFQELVAIKTHEIEAIIQQKLPEEEQSETIHNALTKITSEYLESSKGDIQDPISCIILLYLYSNLEEEERDEKITLLMKSLEYKLKNKEIDFHPLLHNEFYFHVALLIASDITEFFPEKNLPHKI